MNNYSFDKVLKMNPGMPIEQVLSIASMWQDVDMGRDREREEERAQQIRREWIQAVDRLNAEEVLREKEIARRLLTKKKALDAHADRLLQLLDRQARGATALCASLGIDPESRQRDVDKILESWGQNPREYDRMLAAARKRRDAKKARKGRGAGRNLLTAS